MYAQTNIDFLNTYIDLLLLNFSGKSANWPKIHNFKDLSDLWYLKVVDDPLKGRGEGQRVSKDPLSTPKVVLKVVANYSQVSRSCQDLLEDLLEPVDTKIQTFFTHGTRNQNHLIQIFTLWHSYDFFIKLYE